MSAPNSKQAGVGLAIVLLAAAGLLPGCRSTYSKLARTLMESGSRTPAVAFTHVNLIGMTDDGIRRDQTVLVEDGYITAVGESAQVTVSEGTLTVEAGGKYLLPGLIDMHVHLSDENDLPLLLLHGVTTVRNMADLPRWVKAVIGFPDVLSLREKVRSDSLLGPDIYTSGPALDGAPPVSPFNMVVKDAREAEAEVRRQRTAGYDFVKVYDMLSEPAFTGILAAARVHGLSVAGHVPFRVGLEKALAADLLSIEHLTGYINNNHADFIIPRAELLEWAWRTKERGVYNCPTLVTWDRLPPPDGLARLSQQAEYRFASPRIKWLWRQTMKTVYQIDYAPKETYPARMMEISRQMLRALYQARCKLLVGTDTNFVGVFPGSSTLREIELFVETGIAPLDALRAATVNAAECLGRGDLFGTIAAGKRADLLLLNGDPLADIRNIRDIAGVMVRGLWLDESARRLLRDSLAK